MLGVCWKIHRWIYINSLHIFDDDLCICIEFILTLSGQECPTGDHRILQCDMWKKRGFQQLRAKINDFCRGAHLGLVCFYFPKQVARTCVPQKIPTCCLTTGRAMSSLNWTVNQRNIICCDSFPFVRQEFGSSLTIPPKNWQQFDDPTRTR